jgi:hypothetical protein
LRIFQERVEGEGEDDRGEREVKRRDEETE